MNKNHVVQVSVNVTDKATDPLKRISAATSKMSTDFRRIGTSLGAFSNIMGNVASSLDKAANSMYRFNMYTSSIQRNLTNLGLVAGAATVGLGVQSANRAIDFEFKTTKMQTRMETNNTVRKEIENYILNDLSPKSSFKPTEIADLGIILGQAGVNNTPDMKSLLKTTTYFAEAVDANTEEAGKMIISTANGFDISMSNASSITDKLTVALNTSLLEVSEMPHAIGELSGRAKMLGQSFESSLTAIMTGSNQGMTAAQTSQDFLHGLRQLSLIGRDDVLFPQRKEYYEKLGVDTSFFDVKKKQLKEFPEIIASLEKSMANLGMMPNRDDFYKAIEDNGGSIPDGLINKMSSMPLISKVFGAAGQAPIIMGLQSKYTEVDKETGIKTGKVYYGSEALDKMRSDLKESEGIVQEVHDKMAETAKFQLSVLAGVWQAAQIKLADDFLPAIKVATNELTNYISGKGMAGGLDRFNQAVKDSAASLRTTNPLIADLVELTGNVVTNSIKIGTTLGPTMTQSGKAATDNLVKGNWGDSLLTLPYHAVKNGMGFISDVSADNPAADKAISELPPELQDSAKLTRKLIQGGLIIVAAGAIVKIIELAVRAAVVLVKTGKIGLDLSKWLMELFGTKVMGKSPISALSNMTVTAGVVNVYGGAGVPGVPGGGGGLPPVVTNDPGLPPRKKPPTSKIPPIIPGAIIPAATATAFAYGMGFLSSNWEGVYENPNSMYSKSSALTGKGSKPPSDFSKLLYLSGGQVPTLSEEQTNGLSTYLKGKNFTESDSKVIMDNINTINKAIENVKIENKIEFNPVINISGIKEAIGIVDIVWESPLEKMQKTLFQQNKRLDK
jgi:TP901 family phage tail tape measure protein